LKTHPTLILRRPFPLPPLLFRRPPPRFSPFFHLYTVRSVFPPYCPPSSKDFVPPESWFFFTNFPPVLPVFFPFRSGLTHIWPHIRVLFATVPGACNLLAFFSRAVSCLFQVRYFSYLKFPPGLSYYLTFVPPFPSPSGSPPVLLWIFKALQILKWSPFLQSDPLFGKRSFSIPTGVFFLVFSLTGGMVAPPMRLFLPYGLPLLFSGPLGNRLLCVTPNPLPPLPGEIIPTPFFPPKEGLYFLLLGQLP